METVSILDFGSQYTQLIARRVRELETYSEIDDHDRNPEELKERKAIILSGGPASVFEESSQKCHPDLFKLNVPTLGICYGMQMAAHALGGRVERGRIGEYGKTKIILKDCDLFRGLEKEQTVWMSHFDHVAEVPEGAEVLATTEDGIIAAFRMGNFYGLQFHPEVTHTENGRQMLSNFIRNIAGCSGGWTMKGFIQGQKERIKGLVGGSRVLAGVSGGGDSTIAASLVHSVIGDRLSCVYVDTGLQRKGETEEVVRKFRGIGMDIIVVDAEKRFLERLKGVDHPEQKRKIIGNEFIEVFSEKARELKEEGIGFLLQGTLYPDVIESKSPRSGPSATIKTHHNVGGLPEDLKFQLIEPFKWLFKDEVRRVGLELGLPRDMAVKEPFPGPGLGVRFVARTREPDPDFSSRVSEIARSHGMEGTVSPAITVGVQGDERTDRNLVLLSGERDWGRIRAACMEAIRKTPANRVLYVLGGNPSPQASRLEISKKNLDLLREADHIVRSSFREAGIEASQTPVAMFPGRDGPWIAISPFRTDDYMTATPLAAGSELQWELLDCIRERIMSLGIEGVALGVSDKPPSTIEFE